MVVSCRSTHTLSDVHSRSSSTARYPCAIASSIAGRVFSGASYAPRCAHSRVSARALFGLNRSISKNSTAVFSRSARSIAALPLFLSLKLSATYLVLGSSPFSHVVSAQPSSRTNCSVSSNCHRYARNPLGTETRTADLDAGIKLLYALVFA